MKVSIDAEIADLFAVDSDQTVLFKLSTFRDAMTTEHPITLMREKMMGMERACSSVLLPFCVEETDLTREVKRMDIVLELIKRNDAQGLRYVLDMAG